MQKRNHYSLIKSGLILILQTFTSSMEISYELPVIPNAETICEIKVGHGIILTTDSKAYTYRIQKASSATYEADKITDMLQTGTVRSCATGLNFALLGNSKVHSFDFFPYPLKIYGENIGGTGANVPFVLPEGPGVNYGLSEVITNRSLFLVAMDTNPLPNQYKAFRMPLVQILGLNSVFNLLERPTDLAFKNGTFHFIVGYSGGQREIFDHTNPSLSTRHGKLHGNLLQEFSIAAASMNKNFYISAQTGILEIVKFTDTSTKAEINLSSHSLSPIVKKISTVPKSDYVVVLDANGDKVALFNFVAPTESPQIYTFKKGFKTDMVVMNFIRKIVFLDSSRNKLTVMETKNYPCLGDCATCDFAFNTKGCTSCDQGKTHDEEFLCIPDPHQCETRTFFSKKREKCIPCPENCKFCNGNYFEETGFCTLCEEGFSLEYTGKCISCSVEPDNPACRYKQIYLHPLFTMVNRKQRVFEFKMVFEIKLFLQKVSKSTTEDIFPMNQFFKIKYFDENVKEEVDHNNFTAVARGKVVTITLGTSFPDKALNASIEFNGDLPFLMEEGYAFDSLIINKTYSIEFVTAEKILQMELEDKEKNNLKPIKVVSMTVVTGSLITTTITFAFSRILFFLVKYFQIIDILLNLGKIKIKFGERLEKTFNFLENLKLPGIPEEFINMMKTKNPRVYYSKRDVGKLTSKNEDVFIISGNIGITCLSAVICWVIVKFMIRYVLKKIEGDNTRAKLEDQLIIGKRMNKVIKEKKRDGVFVSFIFWLVNMIFKFGFDIYYFDFQLVAFTELSHHKISNFFFQPFDLICSYILSLIIIIVILIELENAYMIMKTGAGEERVKTMNKHKRAILGYYSASLSQEQKFKGSCLFVWSNIRFTIIMALVAGFSFSGVVQVSLILVVDIIFFVYFLKESGKSGFFWGNFTKMNYWMREICILIIILIFLIFGWFEGVEKFEKSWVYQILEVLVVLSVFLTAICEVFSGCFYCFWIIFKHFENKGKNSKEKCSAKNKNKKKVLEKLVKEKSAKNKKKEIFVKKNQSYFSNGQNALNLEKSFTNSPIYGKLMDRKRRREERRKRIDSREQRSRRSNHVSSTKQVLSIFSKSTRYVNRRRSPGLGDLLGS